VSERTLQSSTAGPSHHGDTRPGAILPGTTAVGPRDRPDRVRRRGEEAVAPDLIDDLAQTPETGGEVPPCDLDHEGASRNAEFRSRTLTVVPQSMGL
jgi:hypothetical protein